MGREVGSMNTNRPLKTVAVSNGSEKKRVQNFAIPSGFRVFFLFLPQFSRHFLALSGRHQTLMILDMKI